MRTLSIDYKRSVRFELIDQADEHRYFDFAGLRKANAVLVVYDVTDPVG